MIDRESKSARHHTVTFLVAGLTLCLLTTASASLAGKRAETDRVIDAFMANYATGDAGKMLQSYAEDAVFVDVNQRHRFEGSQALQELLGQLQFMHLDMEIREKRRVVTDNHAALEIVYAGTLNCEALGMKDHDPVSYELPAVILLDIENGRIKRQTDYIDFKTYTELAEKIRGAAPPPPGH